MKNIFCGCAQAHQKSCAFTFAQHEFCRRAFNLRHFCSRAFTLVEMLMALLIVSVILSASLPIISQRQKAMASNYNQNRAFPIGGVILWTDMDKLPDNTWMECNGASLPGGIEYEQARRVFGTNLPDLRNNSMEYINNLNDYLSNDIKNYLQTAIKPIPQNLIGIWASNNAIPEGWTWDRTFDGKFIRGYGSVYTGHYGGVTHSSGAIGAVQGDSIREIAGYVYRNSNCGADGPFVPDLQYPHAAGFMSITGLICYHNLYFYASKATPVSNEIRPVNTAVQFIRYVNAPALPNIPEPPQSKIYYRYIAKVRY